MSTNYNYVGKWKGRRLDAQPKITGQLKFAADQNWPDQLYLKIKHSTIPSGTITAMDTTAAAAIPGVVAIVTPDDVKNNPKWATVKYGSLPVLPFDKIRLGGEEIAAVVAEDPYVAEQACQAIKVTYSPTPFVLHPLTAANASAPQVYDGTNGSANTANLGAPTTYQFGNSDAVFSSPPAGAATFSATYETTSHQANNLMTYAGSVKVDTSGRLEMWSSNQYAKQYSQQLATWFGLPYSRARCYMESCDSGFGDKKPPRRGEILAALLAQKTGRPVHYVYSRDDMLVIGGHRGKVVVQLKAVYQATAGAAPVGTILALQGTVYGAGGYTGGGPAPGCANIMTAIYKLPAFKITAYNVTSNTYANGPIRCVDDPYGVWAINNFLDEIAQKCGISHAALAQLNNMYVAGDKDQQTGNRIASCGQPLVFNQVMSASNYNSKWKAPPASPSGLKGVVHGIGIANMTSVKGSGSSTSAIAMMDADGSVEIHADSNDLGNGRREELCIIAAEQLGVPVGMVTVTNYDSDGGSDTGVTAGSTQTKRAGNSVGLACIDIRNQMLAKAATSLSTTVDKLTYYYDGSMKIALTADPTKSVTFKSLTGEPWLIGVGHYIPPTKTTQLVYGTCVAEIDVDTDTGLVKVTNITQYDDVGQVIYAASIEGQAQAGIIQGINIALQEEMWPDTATGMPLQYSHLDGKLMLIGQTPNITCGYINDAETGPDSPGNFGAKGTAEPWTAAPAGAIYSAFANATGVHVYQLPLTPEKVLAALGKTNVPNGQEYGYGGGA